MKNTNEQSVKQATPTATDVTDLAGTSNVAANAAPKLPTETITLPAGKQFDPKSLILSQDFVSMVGVKREVLRVPIAKPSSQTFFTPHPDERWRIPVAVIEVKEDRENYLVTPALLEELQGEWVPKLLVACQTRQGAHFFWPIRLPGPDGRIDTWNEGAIRIAREYAGKWIRIMANKEIGAYDVIVPITVFPAPVWPDSPDTLMEKAFRDRVIDRVDHPVIQRLRGAV